MNKYIINLNIPDTTLKKMFSNELNNFSKVLDEIYLMSHKYFFNTIFVKCIFSVKVNKIIEKNDIKKITL